MPKHNIALVWGESMSSGPLTKTPNISVAAWADVLETEWLRWTEGNMPDLSGYDLIMVNLFPTPDGTHIQQIKAKYPNKIVVVMPDPPITQVLQHPDWMPMLQQMALADIIGGRTQVDCDVYGRLLNKRARWLPSPAGPDEFFEPYRNLSRANYIVTLDHQWTESISTMQNVAMCAHFQRYLGAQVYYIGAYEHTKEYAKLAGLEAVWIDELEWPEMVALVAQAALSIDVYAQASYHRHQVLCGLLNTALYTDHHQTSLHQEKVCEHTRLYADLFSFKQSLIRIENFLFNIIGTRIA